MVPGNLNFKMQENEARSLHLNLQKPQVQTGQGQPKSRYLKTVRGKMRHIFQVISTSKDFPSRIPIS